MADWHRPFTSAYRFVRVSRETGYELGTIDGIIDGSLTINQDTQTFESAQVNVSPTFDVGADLVRCYLDATWDDGTAESVCLGTWLVSIPSRKVDGITETGTAYLDGRLQELQDDSFDTHLTVAKGANVISYAKGIVEGCGLVAYATDSDKTLDATWRFGLDDGGEEDGGSKLDAVNALLGMANYGAASTDPLGNIVMAPYADPADRAPVWEFVEGVNATFLAKASIERDTRDVANVVIAEYETDESTTIGEAVDDDPASPYSTVSIGRRKVAKYKYNDGATQAAADAQAATLLKTAQTVINRVTLQHVHCPARVGDVVSVSWPSAGISGNYSIRTQKVDIGSAGCLTTSELRRFERA